MSTNIARHPISVHEIVYLLRVSQKVTLENGDLVFFTPLQTALYL